MDLEVVGVDLGDAVVVSAAASHESQVGRLAGKFEVELNDRVVEGRIFQEDSFGFRRIDIRPQQRAVTKRELGFEEPAIAGGLGVEAFREQELPWNAHQSVGQGWSLGICCCGQRREAE